MSCGWICGVTCIQFEPYAKFFLKSLRKKMISSNREKEEGGYKCFSEQCRPPLDLLIKKEAANVVIRDENPKCFIRIDRVSTNRLEP